MALRRRGVGAALSAWSAAERNGVSGQELSGKEEKELQKGLESAAKGRELHAWERRKEF